MKLTKVLHVPDELHNAIKIQAAKEKRPISELVNEVLREYVFKVACYEKQSK
jgi:hypothetical protein